MSHVARENYLHAFGYRGGRVWRNERNADFLSLLPSLIAFIVFSRMEVKLGGNGEER